MLKFLKNNKKEALKTLLFAAIIAMGILFIVGNEFVLKISLYFVGAVIIAISIYILVLVLKSLKRLSNTPYRQTLYFNIILLVLSLISGFSIIANAAGGLLYFQGTLASIFFFRSIHRFLGLYVARQSRNKIATIRLATLACFALAIALFLTFYTKSPFVVGIVAGVALIIEGLIGLYDIWAKQIFRKTKIRNYQANNQYSSKYQNSDSEIIITNYEIVDDSKK